MTEGSGHEVIARYAFRGPGIELERTLPLEVGEQAIIVGRSVTKYRGHGLIRTRRGFFRLSIKRLCIVRQYGFRRDRIIVIPPAAIRDVHGPRQSLSIGFESQRGHEEIVIIMLQATAPTNPTALESNNLAEPLRRIATAMATRMEE
jgi:hypothetical protein